MQCVIDFPSQCDVDVYLIQVERLTFTKCKFNHDF